MLPLGHITIEQLYMNVNLGKLGFSAITKKI
jgi:hypothetical protein